MCSGGGTLCTLCRPHLKLMDLWYFASYFKYLAILAMSLDFNFIRQTLLYLGFSCKMKELFKECTDIFTSQTNPLLTSTTSPIYEYFRKRVPYILEGIEISFSARKKKYTHSRIRSDSTLWNWACLIWRKYFEVKPSKILGILHRLSRYLPTEVKYFN
jgi:hypothetical protein